MFVALSVVVLLSGCVATGRQPEGPQRAPEPTVVFRPAAGSYILSCLENLGSMRSKEFNSYFATEEAQLENSTDEDRLRFICLSLNIKANYKQFKKGEAVLEQYIKEHPDSHDEMAGLLGLVARLDQAKVTRWSNRKKMIDEKEEMEGEVSVLQEEIKALQGECEQDKAKNQELRNQIEQLKNIENIIKNREHSS
jgi:DNA repair exonuclease SbcCD ATPase subunit